MTNPYPDYIRQFILDNYRELTAPDLVRALNAEFNTQYTVGQIRSYKKEHKLASGIITRFRCGHIPVNKGVKGVSYPGPKKTQFRKGSRPHNAVPVGTECRTADGYLKVKTAEPNKWRYKHLLAYEAAYGAVPDKHVVIFLDGARSNCAPENLKAIDRGTLAVANRLRLLSPDAGLTEAGLLVAQVIQAKVKRRKNGR